MSELHGIGGTEEPGLGRRHDIQSDLAKSVGDTVMHVLVELES